MSTLTQTTAAKTGGNGIVSKEAVLIEALPYIQRFEGATFVVKIGGRVMEDAQALRSLGLDVTWLTKIGVHVVLVHGGGKMISEISEKLGLASTIVNGLRVTTPQIRDVAQMVLAGSVNKRLVAGIVAAGGKAVGISGVDADMLRVKEISPDHGLVAEEVSCDTALISLLLGKEFIPVIAPLAVHEGEVYNVNADTAASAIAVALGAEKLIYLSDVGGIETSTGVLSTVTKSIAIDLIEEGVVTGGMIPKTLSAFATIDQGVNKVHIINGQTEHALLLEIFTNEGIGTQFVAESYEEIV